MEREVNKVDTEPTPDPIPIVGESAESTTSYPMEAMEEARHAWYIINLRSIIFHFNYFSANLVNLPVSSDFWILVGYLQIV